jgi:hypothetical protein
MTPRTFIQILIVGGLIAITLACFTAIIFVAGRDQLPFFQRVPETPVVAAQFTAQPTFTPTPTPLPATDTPTPLPPTPTATATATALPTDTPVVVEEAPTATSVSAETAPPPPPTTPPEPPTPTQPAVDFVVAQQRMRTNDENSWDGRLGDCGADHAIYITVVDAAGSPLEGVLVGDTYDNLRVASGTAGLGKATVQLWSNTMALEVQQDIQGTSYTSEASLPLSTKDEDIPTEWLFAGGYCASMEECAMRQQTNSLCRGHYSYDVTFQRTW